MSTKDHKAEILKFAPNNNNNTNGSTPAQVIAQDYLDIIAPLPPPQSIDENYLMKLKRVTSFLGLSTDIESESICEEKPEEKPITQGRTSVYSAVVGQSYKTQKYAMAGPIIKKASAALQSDVSAIASNQILNSQEIVSEIVNNSSTAQDIANQGIQIPPLPGDAWAAGSSAAQDIGSQNNVQIPISDDQAIRLNAINKQTSSNLISLINSVKLGNSPTHQTVNLSSAKLSLDGLGKSSNISNILSLYSDSEFVAQQKLKDALAEKDFKSRVPKILLILDFKEINGDSGKLIICKKVTDAAGYKIRRISFFTGEENDIIFYNEDSENIISNYNSFITEVVRLVDFKTEDVVAFLDKSVQGNNCYFYKMTAFQLFDDSATSIFVVDTFSVNSNKNIRDSITDKNVFVNLSQQYLGDGKFDWIISGINVRESISRRDDRSIARNYSYLNAKSSFIFAQMDKGTFVLPKNINDIIKNINHAITLFGVAQVIQDIVREIGILYYFDGIDQNDDNGFDLIDVSNKNESRFFDVLTNSIDSQTFTVKLRILMNNMKSILSNNTNFLNINSIPVEINPVQPSTTIGLSDLELQIGNLDDIIDLTTFDGISRFIRAIKSIINFGVDNNVS